MIIGNGMIGSAFERILIPDDVIIFASGVSNSSETSESQFLRESDLLLKILGDNPDKKIVYFSTFSIYDIRLVDSPYAKHKIMMEQLIIESGLMYWIARLPQVVGPNGNANGLANYLFNAIKKKETISVWKNAQRNLIDLQDVVKIVNVLINDGQYLNSVINIASTYNTEVVEIIRIFECILGLEAEVRFIEAGSDYCIPNSVINIASQFSEITFSKEYNSKLLYKYYGSLL